MKLRAKAIIFFGAFLLSIVVVDVFYSQYVVRNTLSTQMSNTLLVEAEQAEGTYYAFLKSMKREAVDWTADSEVQRIAKNLVAAETNQSLRLQSERDFLTYFTEKKLPYDKTVFIAELLNKNGDIIASTAPTRVGVNELEEEGAMNTSNFSNAIASNFGEAFASSIYFDPKANDNPVISVAVRIFMSDAKGTPQPIDAVLFLHFSNVQEISDALSGVSQVREGAVTGAAFLANYKTSKIYFVNNDHVVVTPTRYISDVKRYQKIDTLPVGECFINGKETNTEYVDYRGVRVLGSSMCLKNEGLVLIVEVDRDEFLFPITNLLEITLIAVAIAALGGVITIILFMRLPLKRLDDIVEGLNRVVGGDLSVEIKTKSTDEIGLVASMFNKMIATVRRNQESLEASKIELEQSGIALKKEIEERKAQEKFLEESKRATQNLLEDSWEMKEKAEMEGNRLQAIISSIGDAIILIDGSYIISLVNPKACEIFSLPAEDLIDKDLRTIIDICKNKDCLDVRLWPTEEVFLTNKPAFTTLEDDYSIITKGRTTHLPVTISVSPLQGSLHGAVIVISDSTADHELNEAKSGFISVASHQLRTPLTSIRWYSEMLLSEDVGVLNNAQKDFMNEIHSGAERLYQTVDLLLGISRVESGKLKSERTPINLATFTAEIEKEMRPQIREKDLRVHVTAPKDDLVVWLDPLTLRQVVLNLFSNAIRYTNENGLIEIKWWLNKERGREEIVYSVHDNGIGIPEEVRSRIFSKFFRAENARSKVPDGSGLGLALVKELVESWDGRVWFTTVLGDGTTFFFTIPLYSQIADNNTAK